MSFWFVDFGNVKKAVRVCVCVHQRTHMARPNPRRYNDMGLWFMDFSVQSQAQRSLLLSFFPTDNKSVLKRNRKLRFGKSGQVHKLCRNPLSLKCLPLSRSLLADTSLTMQHTLCAQSCFWGRKKHQKELKSDVDEDLKSHQSLIFLVSFLYFPPFSLTTPKFCSQNEDFFVQSKIKRDFE